MNIEQLRAALERMKKHTPTSEGLSCKQIASIMQVGLQKARPIIDAAVESGILVEAPYYHKSAVGVVRKYSGLKLATTKTGTKKTKRS